MSFKGLFLPKLFRDSLKGFAIVFFFQQSEN